MAEKFKKRKITTTLVDKLEPGEMVSDTQYPGYHVRCQKEAKVYFVRKYAHGKHHFVSIGAHGVMGLTEKKARDEAFTILNALKKGLDPSAERAKASGMPTLAEYAVEFLDQRENILKQTTMSEYRSVFKVHIKNSPVGRVKLDKVEREKLKKIHVQLGGKKRDNKPRTANKVLQIISSMYGEAALAGLVPDGFNPAKHIKHYKIEDRERFLTTAEMSRLGEAMATAEREGTSSIYAIAAIHLLIITGARRNEILTMRWDWIDFERRHLILPDSKAGKKPIQLSPEALGILFELPRVEGNPYVIVGKKPGSHWVNLRKTWVRLRNAAVLEPTILPDGTKQQVRLHDLRHTYASFAINDGASLPMIGALLGHTQVSTTARYAHLAADPLRNINDAVGSSVELAMRPKGDNA